MVERQVKSDEWIEHLNQLYQLYRVCYGSLLMDYIFRSFAKSSLWYL